MVSNNSEQESHDPAYDRGNIWIGPQGINPTQLQALKDLLASVDRSSFPRPLPILGPILGLGDGRVTRAILLQYASASRVLARDLTHDEACAFAFYTSKEINLLSYAGPVGFAAGYWRAYRTGKEGKYPFFKAKPDFDPNAFKIPGTSYVLRGLWANKVHMASRYAAYGIYGAIFSFILFAPYVASVGVAGIRLDPRLRSYNETLQQIIRDKVEKQRNTNGRDPRRVSQPPVERGGQQGGGMEPWKQHRRTSTQSQSEEFDDASPSGGQSMDGDQYSSYSEQSFQDSQSQEDITSLAATAELPRRGLPNPGPLNKVEYEGSQQKRHNTSQDFYNYAEDDDASPTASHSDSKGSSSVPAGSAWERLRRGAATNRPPHTSSAPEAQARGDEGSGGDGYSFSQAEADNQLAKEEAQKQFDDRVERERRGGEFGSGGGGKRKWS